MFEIYPGRVAEGQVKGFRTISLLNLAAGSNRMCNSEWLIPHIFLRIDPRLDFPARDRNLRITSKGLEVIGLDPKHAAFFLSFRIRETLEKSTP
jgi:hypothetical protein